MNEYWITQNYLEKATKLLKFKTGGRDLKKTLRAIARVEGWEGGKYEIHQFTGSAEICLKEVEPNEDEPEKAEGVFIFSDLR